MAKAKMSVQIIGLDVLEKQIKRLGKVPQGAVTKAARTGMLIAYRSAKSNAKQVSPGKGGQGNIRKGIIFHPEKRKKGKKVYDIMMDPKMTPIFRKTTSTGLRRRNGKYEKGDYYYPASVEYGFITRGGGYKPGKYFLKRANAENKDKIINKIRSVLFKELDKAILKG
jgi:hypothetical protein